MEAIFDTMPVLLVAVVVFAICFGAHRLGRIARRELDLAVDAFFATSAAISLLALLIGFTFSVALERYDARRALVVEEASAIAALWNRLQFEPDGVREAMGDLTRQYVDERLNYFRFGAPVDRQRAADAAGDAIQAKLWSLARHTSTVDPTPSTQSVVVALARVNDTAWRREAAARDHIPLAVFGILTVFMMAIAAVIGYASAPRYVVHRFPNTAFFALLSLTIAFVVDLDRVRSGLVTVSEQSMIDLRADLLRASPDFAG